MEESAEESNAGGEQYEEEIVPKIITDEVFEEVTTRASAICRDLQNSKQYLVAEDLQKVILVCQNLRQNVIDEKDKIEQMKAEVIASQARVQHAVKMSKQDQEVIQQLKSEIGMKIDTQLLFDIKLNKNLLYILFCLFLSIYTTRFTRSSLAQCGCVFPSWKNRPRSNECAAWKIGKTSKGSGKVFRCWYFWRVNV